MIDHALLLLERRLVLLVDHDQAEVGERQEQRRPRADHHRCGALGHRAPGHPADPRRQVRVPHRRRHAEAALEALQPLRGQRDLRQQHQRLAALAQAFGHRLQIDLGLARPGHPVQQGDGKVPRRHRLPQRGGGGLLIGRQDLAGMLRVRDRERRLDRQHGGDQQPRVRHAPHDAGTNPRGARQFTRRARLPFGQRVQHLAPCLGEPRLGQRIGPPPAGRRRAEPRRDDAQRHRHHLAGRRQGVAGHPIDELAQRRQHRRRVDHRRPPASACRPARPRRPTQSQTTPTSSRRFSGTRTTSPG